MSSKTKILVFIDWFLPAYKAGGPIRSVANLIENTYDLFDFYIITSDRDYLERKSLDTVQSNKWVSFDNKASVFYISIDNLTKKTIKSLIESVDYDVAYINGLYSYYFSILPLQLLKRSQKRIIIAPRGMLSTQAFSSKKLKKRIFLTFAKFSGLYKKVRFQATDKKEINDIKKIISPHSFVSFVPNFPKIPSADNLRQCIKDSGKVFLVSIARISKEKNTLFALQVLLEYTFIGSIQFDIYGSVYNESYWNECKKIIKDLPKNIQVNYKDSIHSSYVNEIFSQNHFSFMPSKGENFGHSIFESLSAGRPVIVSDKTPWKELEEKQIGWDIPLNNKVVFAEIIQRCIDMSQDEYNMMSKKAFIFALNYAQDEALIAETKKLFQGD